MTQRLGTKPYSGRIWFLTFRRLISRELDALAREVWLYPDDESPWTTVAGCPNSGGNLRMHLVGNLWHFIGARFGNSGYVRNRDGEFGTRGGISRDELLTLIDAARAEVSATLSKLGRSLAAFSSMFAAVTGG